MKLSPLAARSLALLGLSAAMIVVLSVSCDSSAGDLDSSWQEYKRKFGKVYSPEEDELRKGIFLASVRKVREQSDKYEINRFSDMTQEEFNQLLGYVDNDVKGSSRNGLESNPKAREFVDEMLRRQVDVPAFWDWRQSSVPRVSKRIRDQFMCGSCWAMATVGLLESRQAILLNDDIEEITDLAVGELVDCMGLNNTCAGRSLHSAIRYINCKGGLVTESSYPYTGKNNSECRNTCESDRLLFPRMELIDDVVENDEISLKKIVYVYGPVVVAFNANGLKDVKKVDLMTKVYKGDDSHCQNKTEGANHAVLLVGYGTHPTDGDYWLIKNSWGGIQAGDDYFKITRGQNTCRVAESPMIVMTDRD